jgi:hypothetical protein
VAFGIGEDQCGCPRPAVEQPAVDAQVLAQQFHVGKQVSGGVRYVYGGIGSIRHTVPAAALVEQHDPEDVRVKQLVGTDAAPKLVQLGPAVYVEPTML